MKKNNKRAAIGIIATSIFFATLSFICYTISSTLANLFESTIAYAETRSTNRPNDMTDETNMIAITDFSKTDLESTHSAPLGETMTTVPNYMSTYLVIVSIEFAILFIVLFLTPIFLRILMAKRSA